MPHRKGGPIGHIGKGDLWATYRKGGPMGHIGKGDLWATAT